MQPIHARRALQVVSPTAIPTGARAPRSRKVQIWLPWLLVAMLAAAVGATQGLRRLGSPTRPSYRTELVTRGVVVGTLKLQGHLQARAAVRVGSISGGQVTAVAVDVGDSVKRGQMLAQLDDLEQRAATADAHASARTAQLRWTRAEKRLAEELAMLDDEGSSAGDLGPEDLLTGSAGNAQLDLMSAYVLLERAGAKRTLAKGLLARRIIRAPIDGIVLARAVDAGETISDSPPGPPLFVIGAEPTRLRLEAEIDDSYAARVRPTTVDLIVPDLPKRSFTASVLQVLPASPRSRVVLEVENRDGALRAGMGAAFALPMETPATSVRVPLAALVPPPPHSSPLDAVVWSVDSKGVRTSVPVETGVVNDRLVEIRAGSLRPGAVVIVTAP